MGGEESGRCEYRVKAGERVCVYVGKVIRWREADTERGRGKRKRNRQNLYELGDAYFCTLEKFSELE